MTEQTVHNTKQDPVWFQVTGECMAPLIRKGDIVLATPVSEVKTGDIIVIAGPIPAVHRIVKIDTNSLLVTKGDNSLTIDPPINEDNIAGKVIAIVKNGKTVYIQGKLWQVKNQVMARYSMVCYSIGRLLSQSSSVSRMYYRFPGPFRHIHIFISTTITRFAGIRSR
jgi:signal peptidase I